MQLHKNLQTFIEANLAADNPNAEALAYAQNFTWDERPPQAGADLYQSYFEQAQINHVEDWKNRHDDYVAEYIELDADERIVPWTFRPENAINQLRQTSPNINLIRIESAQWPCDIFNCATETLREHIEKYQTGDNKEKGQSSLWLRSFVKRWNAERDKRPSFVTTEMEVEEILSDSGNDWAEKLRDYMGLGHYNPAPEGPPVEIIVLRYTVAEVLATLQTNDAHPAAPTVLDSAMSPYFFPSPLPDTDKADTNPYYGHTLNLSLIDNENDYQMGVELLHPYLPYEPQHLYKVGVIAQPFRQELTKARSFHLPWLRLNKARENFGV